MSFSSDGRFVVCDGPGCAERAGAPVGSGLTQAIRARPNAPDTVGWLFVTTDHTYRHYCPRCKEGFLNQLSEEKAQ